MEVRNVYQDDEGKWHVDYGFGHLMGLAIRVYFGQLLIAMFASIFIGLPLLLLATIASGNSLKEKQNNFQNPERSILQESVCNETFN